MMNSHCACLFTDFTEHCYARFPFGLHLDLDEFMGFQAGLDFLEHALCQAVIAYHDDRVEVVAKAAKVADLLGAEL